MADSRGRPTVAVSCRHDFLPVRRDALPWKQTRQLCSAREREREREGEGEGEQGSAGLCLWVNGGWLS